MSKKTRSGRKTRSARTVGPEQLPDAELEVLSSLWNLGGGTAAQVRELMSEFRPMAHGSVLTLLKRLSDKGLVTREKSGQGKAYKYKATVSRDVGYRRLASRLTQRVFGGDAVALIASMLEGSSTSPEDVRKIKKLLDSQKR